MLLSELNVCFFIHVFRSFSMRLSIIISGLRRFVYARRGFNLDGYQTCSFSNMMLLLLLWCCNMIFYCPIWCCSWFRCIEWLHFVKGMRIIGNVLPILVNPVWRGPLEMQLRARGKKGGHVGKKMWGPSGHESWPSLATFEQITPWWQAYSELVAFRLATCKGLSPHCIVILSTNLRALAYTITL